MSHKPTRIGGKDRGSDSLPANGGGDRRVFRAGSASASVLRSISSVPVAGWRKSESGCEREKAERSPGKGEVHWVLKKSRGILVSSSVIHVAGASSSLELDVCAHEADARLPLADQNTSPGNPRVVSLMCPT